MEPVTATTTTTTVTLSPVQILITGALIFCGFKAAEKIAERGASSIERAKQILAERKALKDALPKTRSSAATTEKSVAAKPKKKKPATKKKVQP